MPELPEVETVRRGLEHHVVGRTVDTARVLHPRAVRRQPAARPNSSLPWPGATWTSPGGGVSTCGSPWARTPCSRTWG